MPTGLQLADMSAGSWIVGSYPRWEHRSSTGDDGEEVAVLADRVDRKAMVG